MKKFLLLSLICVAAGLYGCSDDSSNPTSPGTTTDHGYYPLTQGSSWTYDGYLDGKPAQIIHQVNGDTTLDGKRYMKRVLFENGKIQYTYMRRSSDTIYTYSFSEQTPGDKIFLVEKGVGTRWTSYQADLGFEITTNSEIVAKKESFTVNNINYKDVLHVRTIQNVVGWGQNGSLTINIYFAKNIGLIESSTNTQYARLTKYTVK